MSISPFNRSATRDTTQPFQYTSSVTPVDELDEEPRWLGEIVWVKPARKRKVKK